MSKKTGRGKSNSSQNTSSKKEGKKTVRAVRYNNPGCIRDLKKRYYLDPETNQMKAIVPQKGSGGYAIYATKEDGMTALALLLKRYQEKGRTNVQSIVTIYAPAKDNNNTKRYISNVCAALKVSPSEKLNMDDPLVLKTLMKIITEIEGGTQSMQYFDESAYETAVARVCSGKQVENKKETNVLTDTSFVIEKPGWFARNFSRKGAEDYKKWSRLNYIIVCEAPDGRKVTLMDLNNAVLEGRITLAHATRIASASQQTTDKSYTAVNRVLSEMIPHEKQTVQALNTVVEQASQKSIENFKTDIQQEAGGLKKLKQNSSQVIPSENEENVRSLLNKNNQNN